MYTKEQKEIALKEFERLGSVQAVVTLLGYPSCNTLYTWYRDKISGMDRTNGCSRIDTFYVKEGLFPDNSACEGFFGRLKNEMFYGRSWVGVSLDAFINEINSYINWYNTKRIKQSLGYLSPVGYRHTLGLIA